MIRGLFSNLITLIWEPLLKPWQILTDVFPLFS